MACSLEPWLGQQGDEEVTDAYKEKLGSGGLGCMTEKHPEA